MAFDRYIEPFGRDWEQAGLVTASILAPYCKGKLPKPQDFMPLLKLPMTAEEIQAELSKIRRKSDEQT